MQASSIRDEFEEILRSHGYPRTPVTPARGIESMLAFFEQNRVSECPIDHQADMLLYQWGTFDWGHGEHFELDITRQVIPHPEELDPEILQLHVTFCFPPTPTLHQLRGGNRWCESPLDLA